MIYEGYESEEGLTMIPSDHPQKDQEFLLGRGARIIWTFEGKEGEEGWVEAMQAWYDFNGWGVYTPPRDL